MKIERKPLAGGRWLYTAREAGVLVASFKAGALDDDQVRQRFVDDGVVLTTDAPQDVPRRAVAAGHQVPPRPAARVSQRERLAVVVTCHPGYLDWLPRCIASVDQQDQPADVKVLALDGCGEVSVGDDWTVLRGTWGTPVPGRNLGLAVAAERGCGWVIGADADNPQAPGYVAAMRRAVASVGERVGVVYPDIQYLDESGAEVRRRTVADAPFWNLRQLNPGIDTSACWRVAALLAAGGHQDGTGMDDYAVALAITRAGWTAEHAPSYVPDTLMVEHDRDRRSMVHVQNPQVALDNLWRLRTLGVVTLWAAGREETQLGLRRWLASADLPPATSLYIVDNTGGTHARLDVGRDDFDRFASVTVIRDDRPCPDGWAERHGHVAALYRRAFDMAQDDLVLTVEDDMEPDPGAVRQLHRHFNLGSVVGAAAGTYVSPEDPLMACASTDRERWVPLPLDQVGDQVHKVGMAGGGLTLFGGWAIRKALPVEFQNPIGWDGTLSRRLWRAGHAVLLDGGVRVKHHVHGRIGGS